jgi:hypothetical protein
MTIEKNHPFVSRQQLFDYVKADEPSASGH